MTVIDASHNWICRRIPWTGKCLTHLAGVGDIVVLVIGILLTFAHAQALGTPQAQQRWEHQAAQTFRLGRGMERHLMTYVDPVFCCLDVFRLGTTRFKAQTPQQDPRRHRLNDTIPTKSDQDNASRRHP